MLREAIRKMTGQLSDDDLKLADFLRLEQIADETGKAGVIPIKAGWIHEKVQA